MPHRATYWTGTWDPAREAISKEIDALRRASGRRASPVVSFSAGQRTSLSARDGVIRLSSRRALVLRAVAAGVEPRGAVTHVFGRLDEWHLLRAVGRRPVLFTVVVPGTPVNHDLWRKVAHFAAESTPIARAIVAAGVAPDRVSVIYPGVDLREYRPGAAPPEGRFRVLFASSPADPAEFQVRGIPLLVGLARRRSDIDVVLLWREWGDQGAARRALAALSPPPNLIVEMRGDRSMPEVYRSAHVVICPYADGFGKSCPNSVVEGLACGLPALVSDSCGVADLVAGSDAGVAFACTPSGIEAAVERVRTGYDRQREQSRRLAVAHFDLRVFSWRYESLYDALGRARTGRVSAAVSAPFKT